MPNITDPRPGNLQTIIVSKDKAKNANEAKKIAKSVGAVSLDYEETDMSYRFRQRNPTDFVEGSYGSKAIPNGATLVYGKLKSDVKASEDIATMSKILRIQGVPQEIILSESELPNQIQLFKCGTYHDPRYGKFEITPDMLLAMKKNFEEKARGIDLAVDYAHDSDKNAAAWIKKIVLTDNNTKMFAEVEWTGSGKKALSDKEYRYISPDFTNNFVHNETKKEFGPTLNGAALTNRPVIKGMEPVVQLSEIEIEIEPESETINENKGDTMDPKDQKIAELEKMVADLKAKLEGKDMGAEMADMKKQLEEYKAKELAAVEAKKCAEQKAAFDKLLTEGKVVEAQREPYMKNDMVKFTELAQPLKLSEKGHGGNGDETPDAKDKDDAQDQILKLAQKKVADEKITLSEGIRAALKENPKLAEKYNQI